MPLATPKRSTSTPWTLRGRRKPQPPSIWTTERPPNQEESGSPLTDSNRRPPPYHSKRQPVAAGGSGWRLLKPFFGVRGVEALPPFARPLFHNCSIPIRQKRAL